MAILVANVRAKRRQQVTTDKELLDAMRSLTDSVHGLTDAERLLIAQQFRLCHDVSDLTARCIALEARVLASQQSGWADWSKTHPTQATLIILALLLSLSGQLSQLSSIFGVLHAVPVTP